MPRPHDPPAGRPNGLHGDAVALLGSWSAPDPAQEQLRRDFRAHLAAYPDGLWRDGPPAHLTASCLVLDAGGTHVLLTLHRRARMWMQFGGHFEPADVSVHAAAAREAREESGISALQVLPTPVDLDRHVLGDGFTRCTEHLDLRFAARADRDAGHAASEESVAVRWWPVDALPAGVAPDLPRLIGAARGQRDSPNGA